LGCETNLLKSLDVTNNPALTSFGFEHNQITAIDVTKNPLLYSLVFYNNLLTVLDVTKNPGLNILDCGANKITSLDVTKNPALRFLRCMGNLLVDLDLTKNMALTNIWCFGNFLTTMDLTKHVLLIDLRCNNNQLTNLNLKNGANGNIVSMNASHNSGLKCIQVDNAALAAGYTGWLKDVTTQYSNYCSPVISSFTPGTGCTGQSIIIRGANLNEVTAVNFGGVPASSFTVISGSSIEAIVGSGATGNIEITTPGGTATMPGFTYKQSGPPPSINIAVTANDICPGSPVTFTAASANVGTTPSFQWKLNGVNVGGNSRTYTNSSFVNGDKINCVMNTVKECPNTKFVNSDTITMMVKPVPVISFNPAEHAIAPGSSVILNATVTGGFVSYLWSPSTGLNDPFALSPVASPQTSTVYTLNVIAASNCAIDKKIKVTVHKYVRIPNSFTPNGDRINDIFRIPPGTDLDLQVFAVYDRLGKELFKTTDINKGWDGRYKGQMVSPGVYTYVLKGADPRGAVFLKGTVLIIH